ncbi:MAG: M28 family peptidase [bacterium]
MIRSRLTRLVPLIVPALLSAQAPAAATTIIPAPATTLPLKHAPKPTTAAITAGDLMTRLYIFADDSMMGREAGTIGNVKGTDYIAAEVKRMGLVPMGDNGSYFQTIPFKTRVVAPTSVVMIAESKLAAGTEWVLAFGSALPMGTLPVVYGGVIGDNSPRVDPPLAVGKLVVYRVLPNGIGQVQDPTTFPTGAAAVVLLGLDPYMTYFTRPSTFVDDPAKPQPQTPTPVLLFAQPTIAKLFDGPAETLKPGTEGHQTTLAVTVSVEPVKFPARNVVALLPGSDAKLKGEYVAVGAHNDHIGFANEGVDHDSIRIYNHIVRSLGAEDEAKQATAEQQTEINTTLASWRKVHPGSARPDSIANGADDDGSGSVTVLEIAQHLASLPKKPKRSVLFVWHVGEEKGLLGSQYFTDHPTVPRDSIVAQLNIDMVGRGDAWDVTGQSKEGQMLHGGANYLQLVGSRRLSTELGDLVEKVNTESKLGFTFDYAMDANGHPMNIYCRSDHYSYARYGIPIVFFTTGGHSDYHQVTDEPQYIDYAHMARVGQLVSNIAVSAANLDHRIAVDQPKPDPAGACKQ